MTVIDLRAVTRLEVQELGMKAVALDLEFHETGEVVILMEKGVDLLVLGQGDIELGAEAGVLCLERSEF